MLLMKKIKILNIEFGFMDNKITGVTGITAGAATQISRADHSHILISRALYNFINYKLNKDTSYEDLKYSIKSLVKNSLEFDHVLHAIKVKCPNHFDKIEKYKILY